MGGQIGTIHAVRCVETVGRRTNNNRDECFTFYTVACWGKAMIRTLSSQPVPKAAIVVDNAVERGGRVAMMLLGIDLLCKPVLSAL